MGISQSKPQFSLKKTSGATLHHSNKLIIFGENTVNQVAFLLSPVHVTPSSEVVLLKFKVTYGSTRSNPVVGFTFKEVSLSQGLSIEKNKYLCVWYLSRGMVEIEGMLRGFQLPAVESGAEVSIGFTDSGKIGTTIVNPGGRPLKEEILLSNQPTAQIFPFVGDVNTSHSKTEFQLLEDSSLMDMTNKVLFTNSYGVVNIGRDMKSVTRTSTQQGNGCALLPVKISKGIHRWGYEIKCDFGASLCFGIAKYPFMLLENYIKDHLKHVYHHPGLLVYRTYKGLLYRDGKQLSKALGALGWQHNTTVLLEFIFDAQRGTLEVLRNGRSLGIAFEDLSGVFQPVVCFYAAYEKDVHLKHYFTTEPELDIIVQRSPLSSFEAAKPVEKEIDSETIAFEKSLLHGSVNITANSKSLYREKSQSGNAYCFLNAPCFKQGTYRYSFVIEYDQGASTCLGVTQASKPSEVKLTEIGNVYLSPSLYLYRSFQGMIYIKGKEQSTRLEEFWVSGSLVEMEVKVTSSGCSVGFKVNSTDQGTVFTGLQPPLNAVVAFYAGMEKRVTILHYDYSPPQLTEVKPELTSPPSETSSLTSESGLNDVTSTLTEAAAPVLPILCSSSDADIFYPNCLRCEASNDTICLPCKHSTVCSKDLILGINAPTRRCMHCDSKITDVWNIIVTRNLPQSQR